MTKWQNSKKRIFDLSISLIGLTLLWPVIVIAAVIAKIDTGSSGIFSQERIGYEGKPFFVYKIRTMIAETTSHNTNVTTSNDPRISMSGAILRRYKVDELPQLYNVLIGEMSFVGPRPEVPEMVATLSKSDRVILNCRPGITGPATIKYRNEESILASQPHPEQYNLQVLYPDKVQINKKYLDEFSLAGDVRFILITIGILAE